MDKEIKPKNRFLKKAAVAIAGAAIAALPIVPAAAVFRKSRFLIASSGYLSMAEKV